MKVVFLDRDNTLNHDPGYLNDPDQLYLKDGVIEGLTLLKLAGFEFMIISNQSGISRGLVSLKQLDQIHTKLQKIFEENKITIKKIYYCPDQDDTSECRKPNPGMIHNAVKDFPIDLKNSYIIGDRYKDILTGSSLNIPGALIQDASSTKNEETKTLNELGKLPNLLGVVENFLAAAELILRNKYEKKWKNKICKYEEDQFKENILITKNKKQKIVFTNGCFDLWHSGHLQYLGMASQLGDTFIVGLNSDQSVKTLKGDTRPILSQEERAVKLAHLPFVDLVVIFDEETPIELIRSIRPDVHVKGGDYQKSELPEYQVLQDMGAETIILPLKKGLSTTRIIEKIYGRNIRSGKPLI